MKRLRIASLMLAATLAHAGQAAELGEVALRSHQGQQLSADIDLVDLSAADLAELQVRLASPDVFKGASIAMHPALSGLNIAVVKREQRRVLHLTTLQPINAEMMHIFFELQSGGRQSLRSVTLWLTPEPPAPPRPVAAAPEPAPAPVAMPVAAPVPAAAKPVPAKPPAAALPGATEVGGAALPLAAREAELKAAAERAFAARAKPAATPKVAPASKAAAVASCSAVQEDASARECAAADASNKVLTSKLVDLEGKVKVLQAALVAMPDPVKPGVSTKAEKIEPAAAANVKASQPASASAAASAPVVAKAGAASSAASDPHAVAGTIKPAASTAAAEAAKACWWWAPWCIGCVSKKPRAN
jgi:pilus assembly protein FimV